MMIVRDRLRHLRLVATAALLVIFSSAAHHTDSIPLYHQQMPMLALNTVGLSAAQAERAILLALSHNITNVDFHRGPHRQVLRGIMGTRGRKSLYLLTKVDAVNTEDESAAKAATRAVLAGDRKVLGVDAVDMLLLRDAQRCPIIQAQWSVLEEALAAGQARGIGVINFCKSALQCVLETARVKPFVNQFMLHPGMGPDPAGLRSFGEARGVPTMAYGPVGEPGPAEALLSSPLLQRIGAAHGGRTAEEVSLRWLVQSGVPVTMRPSSIFGRKSAGTRTLVGRTTSAHCSAFASLVRKLGGRCAAPRTRRAARAARPPPSPSWPPTRRAARAAGRACPG